jgi:hypothetical protein
VGSASSLSEALVGGVIICMHAAVQILPGNCVGYQPCGLWDCCIGGGEVVINP